MPRCVGRSRFADSRSSVLRGAQPAHHSTVKRIASVRRNMPRHVPPKKKNCA